MKNQVLINYFGLKVKQLRLDRNMTQEKLSFATGFHRTYIGMIERGERNISLTNMAMFAKIFEISISELLEFSSINPKFNYNNYEVKVSDWCLENIRLSWHCPIMSLKKKVSITLLEITQDSLKSI